LPPLYKKSKKGQSLGLNEIRNVLIDNYFISLNYHISGKHDKKKKRVI